jgi:uncharacterized membrane protein (UPF0127 family)
MSFAFGEPPSWIDVEVASHPKELRRGLSGRASLPDDRGMFFDMGFEGDHHFHMQGVAFPLDLLFLSSNWRILGIVHQAQPDHVGTISLGAPSRYVVEVPGGWARRHRIRAGDKGVPVVA